MKTLAPYVAIAIILAFAYGWFQSYQKNQEFERAVSAHRDTLARVLDQKDAYMRALDYTDSLAQRRITKSEEIARRAEDSFDSAVDTLRVYTDKSPDTRAMMDSVVQAHESTVAAKDTVISQLRRKIAARDTLIESLERGLRRSRKLNRMYEENREKGFRPFGVDIPAWTLPAAAGVAGFALAASL